jgi:hypothetical protein
MHRNVIRHWKGFGLIVVIVLVSLVAVLNIAAAQPANLQSVSSGTLGASGWQLTQPGLLEGPTVSGDAARNTVLAAFPGAQARETVLVHVYNQNVVPTLDRLVWVVSIVPLGGIHSNPPPGMPPIRGSYFLVFVDAATGKLLMTTSGGEASL